VSAIDFAVANLESALPERQDRVANLKTVALRLQHVVAGTRKLYETETKSFPPGWRPDGAEWGEGYLRWFYATMARPAYTGKIAVGGVWPGFDDSGAAWGSGRSIGRRCGWTWRDTWRLVEEHRPPIVLIATYNDYEEGTAIEQGVGACLGGSRVLKHPRADLKRET
jgi:hypothetical protein